jgi:hypothetical protein
VTSKQPWPPMSAQKRDTPRAAGAFSPVEGGFVLERVARVVRLWCDTCNKHVRLDDDKPETIELVKADHRHGPTTTLWGSAG